MEVGVAAIPPSAFYCEEHKHLAVNHARFAFCKTDEAIIEAQARFKRHLQSEQSS
jgi:kynurenine aminotransferase